MPLQTQVQFNIIMYALLAGVLIGVMFDFYRIIRGNNGLKVVTVIEDILFWILTAMIVFTFLLYTNYAFLGPYVYIFMIISLVMYLKFISGMVIKFELGVIEVIGTIIRIFFKNFIYPFKVIFHNITGKNN